MTKQLLKPLRVPWMVCPSTPFLKLTANESGDSYVDFVAFNRRFATPTGEFAGGSRKVTIVKGVPDFVPATGPVSAPYQAMRLVLERAIYCRMNYSVSDTECIDDSLYDYSLIPTLQSGESGENDVWKTLELRVSLWDSTGICPAPSAYEVLSSQWVAEVRLPERRDRQWRHFMVKGHDSYVEAIALDITIVQGEAINW